MVLLICPFLPAAKKVNLENSEFSTNNRRLTFEQFPCLPRFVGRLAVGSIFKGTVTGLRPGQNPKKWEVSINRNQFGGSECFKRPGGDHYPDPYYYVTSSTKESSKLRRSEISLASHIGKNISLLWSWHYIFGPNVYKYSIPTELGYGVNKSYSQGEHETNLERFENPNDKSQPAKPSSWPRRICQSQGQFGRAR